MKKRRNTAPGFKEIDPKIVLNKKIGKQKFSLIKKINNISGSHLVWTINIQLHSLNPALDKY